MRPLYKVWASITLASMLAAGYGFRRMSAQTPSGTSFLSQQTKLPPDIHPDTLSRAEKVKRDDLTTEEEKQTFDRIVTFEPKERTSTWLGPTGTRLQIPQLAETYNTQLKLFREQLEQRSYELAISVAIRETDNKEEWLNHVPNREKLLGPKIEEVLMKNQSTAGLDPKDAAIIDYGREMFRAPKVSSKTFAALEQGYGRKKALTVTLIICYYAANELLMRAYDQHMDTRATCSGYHEGCLSAKNAGLVWK